MSSVKSEIPSGSGYRNSVERKKAARNAIVAMELNGRGCANPMLLHMMNGRTRQTVT